MRPLGRGVAYIDGAVQRVYIGKSNPFNLYFFFFFLLAIDNIIKRSFGKLPFYRRLKDRKLSCGRLTIAVYAAILLIPCRMVTA